MLDSKLIANYVPLDQKIESVKKTENLVKLKEQTDKYEALLIKQMLDISLKENESLFGKSTGSHIYQSMYNQTLGDQLAGGFGYSQLLFNFLSKNI